MGQIVLVPPRVRYQKAAPSYGGEMTSHPVMWSGMPPINNDGVACNGSVLVSKPTTEHVIDPLMAYSGLINFGKYSVGSRDTKNPCGSYTNWMGSLSVEDLRVKFWDFSEMQDFVRDNMVGDLLAQHNEDEGRWQFVVCHNADMLAWSTRISQHKAHEFALDGRLKDVVKIWLDAECGIYDLIENRGYGQVYPIRVYIKDEDEALYFKMRWSGADVEREIG